MSLIPWRKLQAGLRMLDDTLPKHIWNNVDTEGEFPEVVKRLWVTYRLRIPVGTDMYD